LSTALVPFHAINASKTPAHQFDSVVNSNKLTVVAVKSPTTVFEEGGHLHGFGYDLVRNYAKNMNVKLDFKTVSDDASALKMVAQGKANMAMTTSSISSIEARKLTSFSATCGDGSSLSSKGLNANLNWPECQPELGFQISQ